MHLQNEFFVFPCIAEYEERKLRQSGNHSAWGLTKVPWGLLEVFWGLTEVSWGLTEVSWGLTEVSWGDLLMFY